jgi:murein DD-endopeptidase MepM/ murein hydrolase activator NlpD
MSAFARNIAVGSRVRQGQIIGYIGSSGLSTGPHLHYEVIVNDNYVDPMRIKVPRSRELDGRMLAEFRRERERIDELRKRSPARQRVGELSVR